MRGPLSVKIVALIAVALSTSSAGAARYFDKLETAALHEEPSEGHALVYIFRPARGAAGIRTWAFVDDELMMVSKDRAYSVAQVPEGQHLFWSKAENTSALALDVEAGQTYFLKLSIRTGFNKARAKLVVVDETRAGKYFEKCSLVEATEEGRLRAARIADRLKHRAEKKAARRGGP